MRKHHEPYNEYVRKEYLRLFYKERHCDAHVVAYPVHFRLLYILCFEKSPACRASARRRKAKAKMLGAIHRLNFCKNNSLFLWSSGLDREMVHAGANSLGARKFHGETLQSHRI